MKVIFMCGADQIGWQDIAPNKPTNMFGEVIPSIGDTVMMEEFKDDKTINEFIVVSRDFYAKKDYNKSYCNQQCIIRLEKPNK